MVSPSEVVRNVRARVGAKHLRYAMVSAIAVPVSQVVLITAHSVFGWAGWQANILAVSVGCVPSYVLNRYWVWNKRSANRFWSEVAPFWGMAVLGLVFSTLLVHAADQWWESTLAVSAANLVAFGSLWVVKFLVLDRYLFGVPVIETPDVATAA
jgi:putative flippase GtrA